METRGNFKVRFVPDAFVGPPFLPVLPDSARVQGCPRVNLDFHVHRGRQKQARRGIQDFLNLTQSTQISPFCFRISKLS